LDVKQGRLRTAFCFAGILTEPATTGELGNFATFDDRVTR
jgi:hypothetical protein